MKSYRDFLNDRGIPKGPWVIRDRGLKPLVETACGLDGEATKAPVRESAIARNPLKLRAV